VPDPAALRDRLAGVRDRIAGAASRAGRDPSSITLVAISKTFPAENIRTLAESGQIDFGENKVQEGLTKIDATSSLSLRWHLVGHLQSNKTKKAVAHFHVIHSIDSVELLRKVDESAISARRTIDCLVQVDLAGEATKHGAPGEAVLGIVAAARECTAARIRGLMLLPPWNEDPEATRPFFRDLRALRERLIAGGVEPASLAHLSMGMSHDFEVAIEEGATMVRVGTAIFGPR